MTQGPGRIAARPIIVTAALPDALFAMANRLRQGHFPPERNHLKAHLTLFHAIPPSCESELRFLLADLARDHPPPPARLTGIVALGRGTALGIESAGLIGLRDAIAERFAGSLSAQDRHRPRLHVTIQNKVSPAAAKKLQAELAGQIAPATFAIPALEMHWYDGGPWEQAGRWAFRGTASRR